MRKVISIVIALIVLFISHGFSYCDDVKLSENLTAVLVGEYESGEILYSYNIDERIEIASITKLMTYLVAMDMISNGDISLNDIVEIGINPTKVGGSTFNLYKGEKVKLETLLNAAIIVSGNDACVAVAEHIAGNEEDFVKMMNNKAKILGLNSAIYYNSSGMPVVTKDGKKVQNNMTVRDIFKLSRYIIKTYPKVLEITSRTEINMPERGYFKENTNPLLNEIPLVDGLKTGYTDEAGYCLITTLEIPKDDDNDKDFRIISIAMGAKSEEERKERSKKIINYVIDNYKKEHIISKDIPIASLEILNAESIKVKIYPKDDVFRLKKVGDSISTKIELNKEIIAPIPKGQKVGIVSINHNDKIQEVDLIVMREVKKAGFFTRLFRVIQNLILRII